MITRPRAPLTCLSLLPFGTALLAASPALAASWETVGDYGGSTNMVIYVPDDVGDSPGLAVALHSCGNQYEGDSQNYFAGAADEHGFIIIAPTNGQPDCWNATAGQDGEKPDIIKMVDWAIANEGADPQRVFVGGASSGACMTISLLSSYPDVFAAGVMMAGVPFGAWSGGGSCGVCSQGASAKSGEEWGEIVRSNAPQGFSGPWPRLQVWHGDADSTLVYGWLAETEKQWKNVLGLSGDGASVTGPSGWNRTEYEEAGAIVLQVNRGPGMDHYLPDDIPQEEMIAFFGLDQDAPVPGTGGASGSGGGSPAIGGGSPAIGGGSPAIGGGSPAMGGGSPAIGGGSPAMGGGSPAVGGWPAAGGFAAIGGGTAAGGALGADGGSPSGGAGAAASTGGGSPTDGGSSGGGCSVGHGPAQRGMFALLLAGAGGLLFARRRPGRQPGT